MNADVEKAVELDELKSDEIKFAQLAWRKALSEEDGYAGASKLMSECFRDGFYAGVRTYWDRVDALHTERVRSTQALRDQEAEIARLREVAHLIPKNWLDPMLTGPSAVLKGYDYKGPDIERLLNAIRARITAHLGANHG